MPAVKALERMTRKFRTNFAGAGAEYEAGVSAPRRPWEEASVAAEPIYVSQVVAAANAGRRVAGVRRVGNAKWVDRAKRLGVNALANSAEVAAEEYGRQVAAVRSAVEGHTLPPDGPKGSPQKAARMTSMRDALIAFGRSRRGGR